MNVYYQSLIHEIRILMSEKHYQNALELIKPELAMPYMEPEALKILNELYSECQAACTIPKVHGADDLEKWIHGTDVQKELAVNLLTGLNLRQFTSQIQDLLDSNLLDEFKGELIEAMMDQKLDMAFHVRKNGLDITFVPGTIVPANQDPGLQQASELFARWFSQNDPGLETFCLHLLQQEVLVNRPYDFTESDPVSLAKSVVRLVYEAMGLESAFDDFCRLNGLDAIVELPLAIEKKRSCQNMNWTKQENAAGTLTVTVEGEAWEKACKKAYSHLKEGLQLKGFRKGQVPDAVAKKQIPEAVVYEDAAQSVAQQALDDGIKEFNLDLVARPVLTVKDANKESVTLEFACVVSPDVELGDWKSIKAQKQPVEVTEEEIETEMKHLQDHFADWVLKEDDEPAESGDQVTIDFVGMKDGTPFEGGSGENYPLVLGSNTFIPGFEDQLIGIKPEEKRTIEVTFPENYQVADLAGQPATFEVTAHDIKKKELPEVNDELIARLKQDGIETVEKYKEEAKKAILAQKEKVADDNFTNDILNQLNEMAKVDIPQVMIDGEVAHMYREFEQNIAQAGFTADQFLQATGQDAAAIKAQMAPEAESRVKMQLVLEALSNAAEIAVTDDMINDEYNMLSSMYNMPAEQIKAIIDPSQIIFNLKQQKALELLKKNAQE